MNEGYILFDFQINGIKQINFVVIPNKYRINK